VNSKKNSENK